MKIYRAMLFIAGVAATSVALAGCASEPPRTERDAESVSFSAALATAQDRGFEWEAAVLKDGTITASEYEQAYDRFMRCQTDLKYVFDKPKYLDPVNGVRWQALSMYLGAGDAPLDKMDGCYDRIFLVEDPYVATAPKRMAPELLTAYRGCLDSNNISYRGDEVNYDDFIAQTDSAANASEGSSHMTCLTDTAFRVYPDLIGVAGFGS